MHNEGAFDAEAAASSGGNLLDHLISVAPKAVLQSHFSFEAPSNGSSHKL
jgi:hypothetical protein